MSALVTRLADLVAISSVHASLPGGPGEQAMADYVAEAAPTVNGVPVKVRLTRT